VALAFGAYAPVTLVRFRARQRRNELRELWHDVVDNLASAVRAGLSLPEALTQLGVRGPEPLRRHPFPALWRRLPRDGSVHLVRDVTRRPAL
jgi:Flp pilus assembly protein TadB